MAALTGLRIVAALWVVGFHFHFTALPGVETVNGWLGPLVTQGALGVDLFFVLSGFVIAWTYLDQLGPRLRLREAGGFVWARAARMWPAYAVVFHLFGMWLVARTVFGSDEAVAYQAVQPSLDVATWLQQVFLVQLWTQPFLDGASWVGPTWSISAEWLAYLLFPVLAVGFHRLRGLPFAVLAAGSLLCAAPVAAAYLVVGSPYYPYSWLVRILGGFGAGVLAMLAVRRLRDRAEADPGTDADVDAGTPRVARLAVGASSAATLLVVAVPFVLLAGTVAGGGLHGLAVLIFPVLVGALALADRGPVHRLLSHRVAVHGGRMSYALYLVHIPMFEVLWYLVDLEVLPRSGMAVHLVALVVFLGTLPVAHLLYTLIERPARRWMRALPGRGRADVAVAAEAVAPTAPGAPSAPEVLRFDSEAARRDPETSVLPAVVAEPQTSVLPVVAPEPATEPATEALPVARRYTTADARTDPATTVFPAIPAVREPAPALPVRSRHRRPVTEPDGTTDGGGATEAPAEPAVAEPGVPGPSVPEPTVPESSVPEPGVPQPTVPEPAATAATGSARWVLERLAAARTAGADGGRDGLGADLVAVSRMRSGGPGTGADLFTPLVDGPGGADGDRVERLRSIQLAGRSGWSPSDPQGGIVPAPRALKASSALPGSRTGAEHCGRRRRDEAHGDSAATPIVTTAGTAGTRRRRRPSHGI